MKDENLQLNAWIAEYVMGLKLNENGMIETWPREGVRHDLAAAMMVLKRCAEKLYGNPDSKMPAEHIEILGSDKDGWVITDPSEEFEADAPTLELAICLFAKKLFSK